MKKLKKNLLETLESIGDELNLWPSIHEEDCGVLGPRLVVVRSVVHPVQGQIRTALELEQVGRVIVQAS